MDGLISCLCSAVYVRLEEKIGRQEEEKRKHRPGGIGRSSGAVRLAFSRLVFGKERDQPDLNAVYCHERKRRHRNLAEEVLPWQTGRHC